MKATLYHLQEPQLHAGRVHFGDMFTNITALPGQVLHCYLDLNQNSMIHFNLIRSSVPTEFILVAPDGRTQVFSTRVSTGPMRAPVYGVYSFFCRSGKLGAGGIRSQFRTAFRGGVHESTRCP